MVSKETKTNGIEAHNRKLTVTVNNKTLENDHDNALPLKLLANDDVVLEINQQQKDIQRRKRRRDGGYRDVRGLSFNL